MSRSGYSEDRDSDYWSFIRWRGAVASAIGGKRGQEMIAEMRDALDAMPEKKLIANDLETLSGEYCALGALGRKRGLAMTSHPNGWASKPRWTRELGLDPEDPDRVAEAFGVAPALIKEIVYENDEFGQWKKVTPEQRWAHMREWCDRYDRLAGTPARRTGS